MSAESEEMAARERSIFLEALKWPDGPERNAYLQGACAGDPELRAGVELLLSNQDNAALMNPPGLTTRLGLVTEKPGDRIGRYKLLQKIGEGGCGVVYMADQQEPVRRRVALKVIKPGMDSREVLARFEAERQALALMDHPNIAKVLDAGATDSGRPYFVMELVRGVKITDFCDDTQNHLSTRRRLDLFTQICNAVQHAHQKGIIHRDIKPSNILVTLQEDGSPTPKIIDFGIAKATGGQKLTDKTLFTAFEQFIGTPAYMSPEQAAMTAVDIDTRSDIYSLGVLLYELLIGETPFETARLARSGIDEIRRIIREEEPPRPSTKLNTLASDTRTLLAQRRQCDPIGLLNLIRGDLDWIVMKCLDKDRSRRYESASAVGADVERHLHNEPILARPPTAAYKFQKMVRRHKLAFAATAAITLALLAGLTVSSWLYYKEREARQAAATAEAKARAEAARARIFASAADDEAAHAQAQARRADQNAAAEAAQRQKTAAALADGDYLHAQDLIDKGKKADALAYLARSISVVPTNSSALLRLTDLLTYSHVLLPDSEFVGITNIADVSTDGRRVLGQDGTGAVAIWDAQTGSKLLNLQRKLDNVQDEILTYYGFTQDGNWIVGDSARDTAATNGFKIKKKSGYAVWPQPLTVPTSAWDSATGKMLTNVFKPEGAYALAYFGFRGKFLVLAESTNGVARIWDAQSQEAISPETHFRTTAYEVYPSADGAKLYTLLADGTMAVWEVPTFRLLRESVTNSELSDSMVQFSHDCNKIAFSCGNAIHVWDFTTGPPGDRLLNCETAFPKCEFSPDDRLLLYTGFLGDQEYALVWDISASAPASNLIAKIPCGNFANFLPDGQRICCGSTNNTMQIWSIRPARLLEETIDDDCFRFASPLVTCRGAVATTDSSSALIWNTKSSNPLPEPETNGGAPQRGGDPPQKPLQMWPESGDKSALMLIFDTDTNHPLFKLKSCGDQLNNPKVQLSTDRKRVAISYWKFYTETKIEVWNTETGDPVSAPFEVSPDIVDRQTAFHPRQNWIATVVSGPSKISTRDLPRIWDFERGLPLTQSWGQYSFGGVTDLHFDARGRQLILADWRKRTLTWDLPPSTGPAPEWLLPLAEAIGGKHLDQRGFLEHTRSNRTEMIREIQKKLTETNAKDDWTVWGRWLLAKPGERTISPFSKMTVAQWAAAQLAANNSASIELLHLYALRTVNMELLRQVESAYRNPVYRIRRLVSTQTDSPPFDEGTEASTDSELLKKFQTIMTGADASQIKSWLQEAIQTPTIDAESWNSVAWAFAACTNDSLRNGSCAVVLAQAVVDGEKELARHMPLENPDLNIPVYVDTLAVAYAECGNYERAIAAEKEAMSFWLSTNNIAHYKTYDGEARLKLFKSGKPYRGRQD